MSRTTHVVMLASRSVGKLRELRSMFAAAGVSIQTLDDAGVDVSPAEDTLEVFDTFEQNALAKARWFHARQRGGITVADDSGLEVDALHGAPGVRSKRWSGREDLHGDALDRANNEYLRDALRRAALEGRPSRAARYVCAAACVWDGGEVVVRGETHGVVLDAPRGAAGFGYDPYVFSVDLQRTFADVSADEKATVSHRGRAFGELIREMRQRGVFDRQPISEVSTPIDPAAANEAEADCAHSG